MQPKTQKQKLWATVCVPLLFYKQCTIHTKATWDMLQGLQTAFRHGDHDKRKEVS